MSKSPTPTLERKSAADVNKAVHAHFDRCMDDLVSALLTTIQCAEFCASVGVLDPETEPAAELAARVGFMTRQLLAHVHGLSAE